MQVWEVASMEVVTSCGYNTTGVGLLLTVERNTLISNKGVTVPGGTLSSSAAPTLRVVAMGGRVGLKMGSNFQIAVMRLVASMAVVGMVLCNLQRTLHAVRTMRSAVEIVSIRLWLGYSRHVFAMRQQPVVGMQKCIHQ
jgi:hypothetical protein